MGKYWLYGRAIGGWLVFLVLAVGLGAVRARFLTPVIGELAAHAVGTLAFVGVILGITAVFIKQIQPCRTLDLWIIGTLWLVLTVAFEFLFFHFGVGKPWEVLLADYNLLQGRIWVLVLIAELLDPPLIGRSMSVRAKKPAAGNDAIT
jgi:hypothetical protein